jgi:hypothetical protein
MDKLKYKTRFKTFRDAVVDGIIFLPLDRLTSWIYPKKSTLSSFCFHNFPVSCSPSLFNNASS